MPPHRSLSLKTFVHAVPWDLFQSYLNRLAVDPPGARNRLPHLDAGESRLHRQGKSSIVLCSHGIRVIHLS